MKIIREPNTEKRLFECETCNCLFEASLHEADSFPVLHVRCSACDRAINWSEGEIIK